MVISIYKQESQVVNQKEPDWTSMELWVDIIRPREDLTPMESDEDDPLYRPRPVPDDPDPFYDEGTSYGFQGIDNESRESRGRMATYCSAVLDTQFRLHTFSIVIIGHRAGLAYWDHYRAAVTRLFDYGQSPSCPLAQFLIRYSQTTPCERAMILPLSHGKSQLLMRLNITA